MTTTPLPVPTEALLCLWKYHSVLPLSPMLCLEDALVLMEGNDSSDWTRPQIDYEQLVTLRLAEKALIPTSMKQGYVLSELGYWYLIQKNLIEDNMEQKHYEHDITYRHGVEAERVLKKMWERWDLSPMFSILPAEDIMDKYPELAKDGEPKETLEYLWGAGLAIRRPKRDGFFADMSTPIICYGYSPNWAAKEYLIRNKIVTIRTAEEQLEHVTNVFNAFERVQDVLIEVVHEDMRELMTMIDELMAKDNTDF
jgi:hypothetical protein